MTDAAPTDAASPEPLGALPEWRLDDLYAGRDDPALTRALDTAARQAKAFNTEFAGKLAELTGDALGGAVERYEQIDETLTRVLSYAYLVYAQDMSEPENGRFLQGMQERATAISKDLVFFTLELNRLSDSAMETALAAPRLARAAAPVASK